MHGGPLGRRSRARLLAHFPPGCQYGAPPILGAIALGVGICIAQTSGPQRYGHFTSRDDLGRGEGFRERAAIQNRDCREKKTSCRHRFRGLQSGLTRCGLRHSPARPEPILSLPQSADKGTSARECRKLGVLSGNAPWSRSAARRSTTRAPPPASRPSSTDTRLCPIRHVRYWDGTLPRTAQA